MSIDIINLRVEEAIERTVWEDDEKLYGVEEAAEAAITAATPHIRAALFDELIAALSHPHECAVWDGPHGPCVDTSVVAWITKYKETT